MDPFTILALGSAGLGFLQGKANEKKMADQDTFRKNVLAVQPWLKMQDPGALNLPGALGSAAQGGMTGALLGKTIGMESPWAVKPTGVDEAAQAAAAQAVPANPTVDEGALSEEALYAQHPELRNLRTGMLPKMGPWTALQRVPGF